MWLYVDAIGYSWDSNYNIGDNLLPIPTVLNFTSTINSDPMDNLVYSFKTNTTQLVELYVYKVGSSIQNIGLS